MLLMMVVVGNVLKESAIGVLIAVLYAMAFSCPPLSLLLARLLLWWRCLTFLKDFEADGGR